MSTKSKKYVAYYRVSTREQGRSKLGLEAQQEMVKRTITDGTVVKHFTEVESGKKNNRPKLNEAINYCKENNCTLAIAKLDRLSRSVSFIFALKEAGIEFQACDLPVCNTVTLGIFASLAQYERELISQRTRDALQAKKKQGFKLGTPRNLDEKARAKGRETYKKQAIANHQKAFAFANRLKKAGVNIKEIASALNEQGFKTSRGKLFKYHNVVYLLRYMSKNNQPKKKGIKNEL
jgi:DNA invertase Pin-like site-specific DNA recombinase